MLFAGYNTLESNMSDCIFCKIINKELPSNVVFETKDVVAFPDINPSADVHILIVPKQHIASIGEVKENGDLLSEIFKAADKLVDDFNLSEGLYRVLVNGGQAQHVPHVHFHLLGGRWLKKENF